MSESLRQLRSTSLEDLVAKHDEHAKQTVVGTQHYLDEIHRRDNERTGNTIKSLTWVISAMTLVMMIATIANVILFIAR